MLRLIVNTSGAHILKGGDRECMLSFLVGLDVGAADVDDTGALTFISGLANWEQ